jgi:hypothetical protein
MDIQPKAQQPISDDQELAKVLAGVNQQAEEAADTAPAEDTTIVPAPAVEEPVADVVPTVAEPAVVPPMPDPIAAPVSLAAPSGDLDAVKQEALSELRPLVDKLDVSPEEKFDTYLLLLRSTDDKALIAPAHEAARGIADEARRAQALLDIIKEIDYLSGAAQQPAA